MQSGHKKGRVGVGLILVLLALVGTPAAVLAQTVGPGGGGPLPGSLTTLSKDDPACNTTAPKPADALRLVYCARANASGLANISTADFAATPQTLGVFELQNARVGDRSVEVGLSMGAILKASLKLQATPTWAKADGAVYNSLTKTLQFNVKSGSIYAIFTLQPGSQGALPDTGGPKTSSATSDDSLALEFRIGLVMLTLVAMGGGFFIWRKSFIKK